jgi:two-component system cell cycle sensor histidine kinase/response regulator CckA
MLHQSAGRNEEQYNENDWTHILLESMDDPVCLLDPSGVILDANPACNAWISRYYKTCIGSNIYKIISSHPALQIYYPQWKKMIEEVLQSGRSCSFENSGDERTVRYTTYPVFSSDGRNRRVCVIARMVTESNKKDNNELGSRQLWELILEKCHVGAWSMNLVSGILYHTLEQDRLFGYDKPVDDWGYERFRNHVIPEDRKFVDKLFNGILATSEEWDTEFRILRKDGLIRWLSTSGAAMKDEQGKTVCISGISRDITEQKAARIEHESFQAKMEYALENSHVGVWDLDLKKNMVTRTLEHDRIFGYETLLPKWTTESFFEHLDPEDLAMVRSEYRKAMSDKSDFKLECRIRKVNGQTGWISLAGTYKFNKDNEDPHVVGIVQDITDRKQAELDGKKLQTQLQQSQKMEMVGQLAGGIAHDFNNVLAVILGNTEIMMRQLDNRHPFFENLDSIRHSVNRSAEMIGHLLAFARKQVWHPQLIDIEEELQKIHAMLRKLIRENIRLELRLENRHPMVKIDPSHLVQIITNLCINSRDAIISDGNIIIETRIVKDSECRHLEPGSCELSGECVMISISDTGRGIDKEDLPHIFEPFYTTKETGKGSGLGLAVVYGIVKQNKGGIDCHSESGKGTKIDIYFPKSASDELIRKIQPADYNEKRCNEAVLLVEDEPHIMKIISNLLENIGLQVLTAESAEKALTVFHEHRENISIVISDIVLPGINGVQLSRNLRNEKRNLKFIFMSGYGSDAIGNYGEFKYGENFISKPFSSKDFLKLVNSVTARKADYSL